MQLLLIRECWNAAVVKQFSLERAQVWLPKRTRSDQGTSAASRTSAAQVRRALLALCLLLCAPALLGQQTFRNLTGTVTDGHHEPLKGVVVEVENSVSMTVISYITGRSGTYSFKRLDGDTDYRVWATFHGQRSKVKQLGKFDSNKPKIINFVMKER